MKYSLKHLEITASPYNRPTFHGKLRVEEYGSDEWILLEDYSYTTLVLGRPLQLTAKAGFISDLSSIPWFAQWLVSKVGRHRRGAIHHDALFRYAGLHPIKKKQADAIYHEANYVSNVPEYRRQILINGLRAGSWRNWHKYKRKNTK